MKRWLLLVVLAVMLGCANKNDSGADGGVAFSSDEQGAYDSGAGGVPLLIEVAEIADSFFQFDPTLDPTQSDTANTGLVGNHVSQNLGAVGDGGATCGSVSISGTTVTANFGAAPGCTLKNGVALSGTIAVTITKTGSSIGVAFQFTNATVNGTALAGTMTFTTSDGSTFTVDANLTSGTSTFTATGLSISGANGSLTLDGSFTSGTTTISFATVAWKLGDCYPNAGSVTIKMGVISETVTFSAASATTGAVTVTVGKKTVNATLPTYGKCA